MFNMFVFFHCHRKEHTFSVLAPWVDHSKKVWRIQQGQKHAFALTNFSFHHTSDYVGTSKLNCRKSAAKHLSACGSAKSSSTARVQEYFLVFSAELHFVTGTDFAAVWIFVLSADHILSWRLPSCFLLPHSHNSSCSIVWICGIVFYIQLFSQTMHPPKKNNCPNKLQNVWHRFVKQKCKHLDNRLAC